MNYLNSPYYFKLIEDECVAKDFIEFWKRFYNEEKYPEEKYVKCLNFGGLLEKNSIEFLWEWKNGGKLSQKKVPIISKTIQYLDKINKFRKMNKLTENEERDLWELSEKITNGFIWKIFLFHITKPNQFPMFDQHVSRAYQYLKTKTFTKNKAYTKNTYSQYRKFFYSIVKESGKTTREVDQALWAYGKYLSTNKPITTK